MSWSALDWAVLVVIVGWVLLEWAVLVVIVGWVLEDIVSTWRKGGGGE